MVASLADLLKYTHTLQVTIVWFILFTVAAANLVHELVSLGLDLLLQSFGIGQILERADDKYFKTLKPDGAESVWSVKCGSFNQDKHHVQYM